MGSNDDEDTECTEVSRIAEHERDIAIKRINTCCIAERQVNGEYKSCPRRMAGIWLGYGLRKLCTIKRFPFAFNTTVGHHYVCLYHRRLIHYERQLQPSELLDNRNLLAYEIRTPFNSDELLEINDDPALKSEEGYEGGDSAQISSDNPEFKLQEEEYESNMWKSLFRLIDDADFSTDSGCEAVKSQLKYLMSDQPVQCDPSEMSIMPSLHSVSTTTLRRYRREYGLSIPSNMSSKQQMVDAVIEHFKTIEIPCSDRRLMQLIKNFRIYNKNGSLISTERLTT